MNSLSLKCVHAPKTRTRPQSPFSQAPRLLAGDRIHVEGKQLRFAIQKSETDSIVPLGTADIHDSVIPVPSDFVDDIVQFQLIRPSPLRGDRSPDGFIEVRHPTKWAGQNFRRSISRIERFLEQPLIKLKLPAEMERSTPVKQLWRKSLGKTAEMQFHYPITLQSSLREIFIQRNRTRDGCLPDIRRVNDGLSYR
jgi:hypothetical protein